jgi:glycyl-tRNA synthetase beta chain
MNNPETNILQADLLVEIGCEELPPKTLQQLARSFYDGVCKGLGDAGMPVDVENGTVFYTPRRLGFRLPQVPSRQADQVLDRRGPAVSAAFDADGKPTPAALGFARSVGREIEHLERYETDKGEWLFCRVDIPGKPLDEVLYPVMEKSLAALPVAKPMRWSDHSFSFVRPVHWLTVLHGNEIVAGALFGKKAGNLTWGHRMHNPGPHVIGSPRDYESVLSAAYVMVDPVARKAKIRDLAEKAGDEQGGTTRITDSLLDEVTNIIEWPYAVKCRFEGAFLQVPEEALVASMEDHQKFFPVLNREDGSLTSGFVAIANLESTHVSSVQEGFERVIRPRLADAQFFWEQDKKIPLEEYTRALDDIVFQKNLGSVGDKSRRIATIARLLAEFSNQDPGLAERASSLCKADLQTQMVGEFPELQGIMGAYYARASGEPDEVSLAIAQHYSPRYSGDAIPTSPLGQLLSIADRIDTLVGVLAAGQKPSGNKDPYALRRAALGIVRILCEAEIPVPLDHLLDISAEALKDRISVNTDCLAQARDFMLDRLRQYFLDRGFGANIVNSIFAAPLTDLPDLQSRLGALAGFMELPVAETLIAANKRIGNILRKSRQKISTKINVKLLTIDAERSLFEDISALESSLEPLFKNAEYSSALTALAGLNDAIATFFDHVMVLDDNPLIRDNRLALLSRLKGLFDRVGDLSLAT